MDTVASVPIEGTGHLEGAWQRSPWLANVPIRMFEGLLNGAGRVIVVSPHPDDEVLGCGGLIHHARQAGIEVRILAVTRGEACYPGHPRWTPARLRAMRVSELRLAAAELGVLSTAITSLDFTDGSVAQAESALIGAVAAQLRPTDHVFCTAAWDGHPDHEAVGRASRAAADLQQTRLSEFPIWAWHWADPMGLMPPRGGAVRYRLGTAAWQAKQRALACFTSQRAGPGDCDPILPAHVIERFERGEELFFHDSD